MLPAPTGDVTKRGAVQATRVGWQPNYGDTGGDRRVTPSSTDRRLIRPFGGLLAITVALGMSVAAVGVRAAAGARLRDAGLPTADAVGLASLFAVAVIGAAAKYHDHVRTIPAATPAQERLRRATSVVLSASAVLVPFALLLLRRPGTPSRAIPPSHPAQPPPQPPGRGRFSFDLHAFLVVLAIVIGALVLAGLAVAAVLLLRKILVASPTASTPATGESEAEDEALAAALLAGRSALAGHDARAAIIACYAAMEASLEQVGVIRERSDSPSDLLRRATSPDLPGDEAQHAATLTELFREARFSTHPMTARQLDKARSALDAVTAALAERIRAQALAS